MEIREYYSEAILTPERLTFIFSKSIFTRHGATLFNEKGLLQGTTDTSLSSKGAEDAQKMTDVLTSNHFNVGHILTSNMRRAYQTAQYIQKSVDPKYPSEKTTLIIHDPLWREYNFGEWEGREVASLKKYPPHESWVRNPFTGSESGLPPQGENFYTFLKRTNTALRSAEIYAKKLPSHTHQLIVTHATVLRGVRFIGILSLAGIELTDAQAIKKFEKYFFYTSENQLDLSFIRIPHLPLKVDLNSTSFLDLKIPQ